MTGGRALPRRARVASRRPRGPSHWRGSAEFHLTRRSIGFRTESRESRQLFLAFYIVVFGPLGWLAPVLGALLLVFTIALAAGLAYRARPRVRARRARRRLELLATGPEGEGDVVRLEGTVSASERADGVVLGVGPQVWPTRFTVAFEGGEAQVEPSALFVGAAREVRLGDRIELLGPARSTSRGGGGYRAARRTFFFEGTPERPLFVRTLPA